MKLKTTLALLLMLVFMAGCTSGEDASVPTDETTNPKEEVTYNTEEKEDTIIFVLTGNGQPPEKDTVGSGSVHENTIRETGG